MDDANRPTRAPLPRPDEPRDYESGTGNMARDGYHVVARRPRVAGYSDLVAPERARSIEGIVRGYEDSMIGSGNRIEVEVEDDD